MTGVKRAILPLSLVAAVIVVLGLALTYGIRDTTSPLYDVTVQFDTEATQTDIDATTSILRSYDSSVSYVLQESFPPTGHARLRSRIASFCTDLRRKMEAVHGVGGATCQLATPPVPSTPDTPVHSP